MPRTTAVVPAPSGAPARNLRSRDKSPAAPKPAPLQRKKRKAIKSAATVEESPSLPESEDPQSEQVT